MASGFVPSTPPLIKPNKRRRLDEPFDEEPLTSPSKFGELGLHVLLSPKKEREKQETAVIARRLSFSDNDTRKTKTKTSEDGAGDGYRESVYVTAFTTAVETVIEREGHLFSNDEMDIIKTYLDLPCFIIMEAS
jgi:hypothetical protein